MATDNKLKFSRVLVTLAEVYGRTLTAEVITVYWSVFSQYPMDQIETAARRHVEKAKFFPTPAELLGYIPAANANQHIGADEAWGIALESFDEFSTVVITKEITEARGLVLEVYETGDVTGARMAFRDAYNRIIASAEKPQWFVSEGFDGARKADAVMKAIQLGRLPPGSESKYLLEASTITVAGLIGAANSKTQKSLDAEFRKSALRNLGALKAMLGMDDDGIDRREKERKAFEQHRQQELSRLAQKAGELH